MTWTAPRTWVTGEVVTSTVMNTHVRDNLIAILPVGTFIYRAALHTAVETSIEGRWLECNGVAVSRTTYSALSTYLAALTPAYPFGAGNGTTTFNVPDTRGRVPVGHSPSGAAAVDVLGENDGRAQNIRSVSHRHNLLDGAGNPVYSGGAGAPDGAVPGGTANTGAPAFTTGDGNNFNSAAYLVGGAWFIKYTS